MGKLFLVSVGPGFRDLIPPLAEKAIQASDALVSYDLYLRWIEPWTRHKAIHSFPLTQERGRALKAIALAREGHTVSLISSGDIGVYAMGTLAFELMEEQEPFSVEVIPGITAANACASLLGAPLSHDFATLSLSDLLCPWEWIEKRASHIAQADLAAVFYNVQSRTRREGVYRILQILLEHKTPDTLCGIVRNAFREDQEVQICTLYDLLERRFDMLTTLVIGNRFTRRRGVYLFTPRGYEGWQRSTNGNVDEPANRSDSAGPLSIHSEIPERAIWVFSGTSDGNTLAQQIQEEGMPVVISTASEYGKRVVQQQHPEIPVITGYKGQSMRRKLLQKTMARVIVDGTHPFAVGISQQLMQLAGELHIPYVRYERAPSPMLTDAHYCSSMIDAAETAVELGHRIFLATGSKDLSIFLQTAQTTQCEWFVRLTPDPGMLQNALDAGIAYNHICAMQGPFSQAQNEQLWKDWQIDCVVTKDSGEAGGFPAKASAAQNLKIPLVVVQRPQLSYPLVMERMGDIVRHVRGL